MLNKTFSVIFKQRADPRYISNCRQDTQNLDEDMTETNLAGWPATRRRAHGRLTAAPCIGDHFMLPPPASGCYGRLRIGSRGGRPVVVAATLTGSTISMLVRSINLKWPFLLGGDTGGSHFHAHRNFAAEVPVWLFPRYSFCISLYYFHQVSIFGCILDLQKHRRPLPNCIFAASAEKRTVVSTDVSAETTTTELYPRIALVFYSCNGTAPTTI